MFQMEAAFAVADAQEGDFSLIIARLENPEIKLEQIERNFLAEHLAGRKRGRPTQPPGWKVARVQALYFWLMAVEKWPKEAALLEIERVLPVGKGTSRNYLSKKLAGMPGLWAVTTFKEIKRAAQGELSREEFDDLRASVGLPLKK